MSKKLTLFMVGGVLVLSGMFLGLTSALMVPVFYGASSFILNTAEAETDVRGVDIRNTHDENLVRQFGIAGALTILSALMILYYWYRPNWWGETKRKISLLQI